MDKHAVADILNEIALLLELKGENPFKTRAYINGARTLESLEESLETLIEENRLRELKGFGDALQKKVTELVSTGKMTYYEDLKESLPAGLLEMTDLPGVGPKKVRALYEELDIDSIEKLEAACKDGKVAELGGFGKKTEQKILEGIDFRRKFASKFHLHHALAAAEPILEALRDHPAVIRCTTAGSLRRSKEIIGDLDFLVSSRKPVDVITYFTQLPGVMKIIAAGDTKASVNLEDGLQADLRVVNDAEFPFASHYFTGSKEHNIVMRQRAIDRGLRLNEYGLFKSKEETRDPKRLVTCNTEQEIFDHLGLDYIEPELREDMGEFDAAEKGTLPRLLEWTDLRGSLHNHSNWSDGHQTLRGIADMAIELGLEYWAVTDHSKSSFQANGLSPERLRDQLKKVAELNAQLADEGQEFQLLTGTEVDILNKGKLDFEDELLAELDVVVASVHQGFTQKEDEMTRRIITAAENPHVHMLGHLTGRLLLERNAYAVNQHAVIDACAETGTWIELNASPWRFDMDWRLWPYAKKKGVRCVINCDAHQESHAGYLRLGAGVARKGWLEKNDVINTLPLKKLKEALKGKVA